MKSQPMQPQTVDSAPEGRQSAVPDSAPCGHTQHAGSGSDARPAVCASVRPGRRSARFRAIEALAHGHPPQPTHGRRTRRHALPAWTIAGAAMASLVGLSLAPAAAATYPNQPVQLLVSFPPGGATDLVARALASEMGRDLGQAVVVQNRAGAGGAVGTAAIAQANPNGDTAGLISVAALTILPHMQTTPYGMDDFSFICQAYDIPVFISVAPNSPFRTIDDLLTHARANPDQVNYATVGPGSLPNMAALDLMRAANIQMNHIPYKGEALAVTDLLGGHVDVYFGTNAVASRSGLHRLAVAAAQRTEESADIPTLREAGYDVVWSIIGGMLGPKDLAAAHRDRLEQACETAAATEAYRSALHNLNIRPLYANGTDFEATLRQESATNRQLLGAVGLLAP